MFMGLTRLGGRVSSVRGGPQGAAALQPADGFTVSPQLLEQSEWQPTSVDGKGYLLNEPGAQPSSVYADFSCKEEPEIDSPGGKRSPGPYGFWEKEETVIMETGKCLEAEADKRSFLNWASRYSSEVLFHAEAGLRKDELCLLWTMCVGLSYSSL